MKSIMALLITLWGVSGCNPDFTDPTREFAEASSSNVAAYPTKIHQPPGLGFIKSGKYNEQGEPISVPCSTCHSPGAGDKEPWVKRIDAPKKFHRDVKLKHANLSCNACHLSNNGSILHLADGHTLEIRETMTLCAQCHGVQFRDYQHGSHGGMTGYWDRRKGPRYRNHCVDCHAPHDPEYKSVYPVHPPRDRYLDQTSLQESNH